jgi:hypothetical protein
MPPWAYAAVGAGGVMSLLLMIFVVKSLVGSAGTVGIPENPTPGALKGLW